MILYGNIGALSRLDFTVIGTTVNMASRLEGLCSPLKQDLLCSEVFAQHSKREFESLGEQHLKGFDKPAMVFKPCRSE